MSDKINRESFIQCLESVRAGISTQAIFEQGDCFVFSKGRVTTFNDEVFCSAPSPISKSFTGAVPAKEFMEVLAKLPDEELDFIPQEDSLLLCGKGKRRKVGLRLESEIVLPIDGIEKPKKWLPLHGDFCEAVGLVGLCAGQGKDARVESTCVHIHPKFLEAADRAQCCRWMLKTGVAEPTLVRQESIKHIVSLGMTELAETDKWIHFRNANGLTLSCRRYLESYPDFTNMLDAEGESIALPKQLAEAAERAAIFSRDNPGAGGNYVSVDLSPGKLRVKGQGLMGWYSETSKIAYQGQKLSFYTSPEMLSGLVKRHQECVVTEDKLKVSNPKFIYVLALKKPSDVAVASNGEAVEAEASTEGGE